MQKGSFITIAVHGVPSGFGTIAILLSYPELRQTPQKNETQKNEKHENYESLEILPAENISTVKSAEINNKTNDPSNNIIYPLTNIINDTTDAGHDSSQTPNDSVLYAVILIIILIATYIMVNRNK